MKRKGDIMINDDLRSTRLTWQDIDEEAHSMSDLDIERQSAEYLKWWESLGIYEEAQIAQAQYEHDHPELYPPDAERTAKKVCAICGSEGNTTDICDTCRANIIRHKNEILERVKKTGRTLTTKGTP